MSNDSEDIETRQERREKRAEKKKESMAKHSRNLAKVYRDAILKRLRGKKSEKQG
ncbi:MAG TPA: hypothetical protein G4O19_04495 [Dehalococcoidia bacterium]|nr:hypothetical protein [Dehalococcoidia bacterium]